jgi:hypothetical protein
MEETNRKIQVHVNTQVYFFNRPGKRIMAVAQQGCTGFRFDTMLRPAAAVVSPRWRISSPVKGPCPGRINL